MIQTYLTQIWLVSCIKVIGDKTFLVQKYFGKDEKQTQGQLSATTLNDFIKKDLGSKAILDSEVTNTQSKELDK